DTIFEQQHNAVAQYKGQVYTVGDREQFITEYYMAATNSWGAVQRDQTLTTCSLIVLKDRLYAVNDFRKIKTYDPDKNSWDELECPPSLRCGTCCVSDGQHLYIAGGRVWTFGMFEEVATTERFDPSENRLEEVADMMIKRSDAFGAAMNGKVYIAGGKQYNSGGRSTFYVGLVINACEMYNPVTDEWQLMPSLGMVCVKGALYVIGGCGENREAELSVEMFDSDSNKWKKKSIIPISPKQQESNNGYYYIACQFASINIGVLKQLRPLGLKIQSFLDGGHSD
ncbi:Kelch-like protein 33, partial [Desmophyllum pertusum]